jgi:phosphoribosylformylglycinamidine (FGAM) synthase-like enzyme
LFSESPSRFLVEVEKDKKEEFQQQFKGVPFGLVGCTAEEKKLTIYNKKSSKIVDISLQLIKESLLKPFAEFRWKPKK